MNTEEQYEVYPIPPNLRGMIPVLGNSIRTANLIQACILSLLVFIAVFAVLTMYEVEDLASVTGWALVPASAVGALCIHGINGDSVLGFLKSLLRYGKRRRTAYYNPRVKQEAVSIVKAVSDAETDVLPRQKLQQLLERYKEKAEQRNSEEHLSMEENAGGFDQSRMFFEDDVGIIDKPLEYMTKKERRAYEKRRRKEEKAIRKELKKAEKGRKKNARGKKKEKKIAGIR